LVAGGSSLSILPGGVVLASPAVTAAAGGAGSVVAMGEEAVAMKSKTVTIQADGVCSIKGKSALKLQEEGPKGKERGSGGERKVPPSSGTNATASGGEEPHVYDEQIQLVDDDTGKPIAYCPYVILQGDCLLQEGRTDQTGMTARVASGASEAELTILWGDDALAWS
jgi:hypothetical protein